MYIGSHKTVYDNPIIFLFTIKKVRKKIYPKYIYFYIKGVSINSQHAEPTVMDINKPIVKSANEHPYADNPLDMLCSTIENQSTANMDEAHYSKLHEIVKISQIYGTGNEPITMRTNVGNVKVSLQSHPYTIGDPVSQDQATKMCLIQGPTSILS